MFVELTRKPKLKSYPIPESIGQYTSASLLCVPYSCRLVQHLQERKLFQRSLTAIGIDAINYGRYTQDESDQNVHHLVAVYFDMSAKCSKKKMKIELV